MAKGRGTGKWAVTGCGMPSARTGPAAARKFAAQTTRPRGGLTCQTCERYPEACKDIETILRTWGSGEGQRSLTKLHAWLVENHGYDMRIGGLQKHVARCTPSLWEAARNPAKG